MATLLAEFAPLAPAPLCPELLVHNAHALVPVWEAAESLAGTALAAPFWAYPWPGGSALARLLLDNPEWVRGKRVLDFGCGGGITSIAAAHCGADVTANDIDPWALLVTSLAATAQGLSVSLLGDDVCADLSIVDRYDVILCSDLAYERRETPRQRCVLDRAQHRGALVLVANAERTYFSDSGMTLLSTQTLAVPQDLEGVTSRVACVYKYSSQF
jgi:predicted nicotinamide N-methyase